MTTAKEQQFTPAQRFWDAFRSCVEENSVTPGHSPYYVKWVQAFSRFLSQEPLRDRSREDIAAFLADLGKRPGTAEWQVKEAEHALKILCEVFLLAYSAANSTEAGDRSGKKAQDPGFRAGTFRDRALPGEVERCFAPLIDAMSQMIRALHHHDLYPCAEQRGLSGIGLLISDTQRSSLLHADAPGL